MTDNEIMKALECCSHRNEDLPCDGCPAYNIAQMCMEYLMSDALDLINRQKNKIKRLKNENKILSINADTAFQDGLNEAQDLYAEQVKDEIKSEAIKEFAKKLKEEIRCEDDCGYHCYGCCYECKDYVIAVDNLVKEMTEGN